MIDLRALWERSNRRCTSALVLSVLFSLWGTIVAISGGTRFNVAGIVVSARSYERPFFMSVVAALFYLTLSASRRRERWSDVPRLTARVCSLVAAGIALAVALAAFRHGAFIAGGSDSYGYLSQAQSWLSGRPEIAQPWIAEMSWPEAAQAAAPVGYRSGLRPNEIVPTYPPGLPMLLALAGAISRGHALTLVIPLLSALTVWLTFLIASEAAG